MPIQHTTRRELDSFIQEQRIDRFFLSKLTLQSSKTMELFQIDLKNCEPKIEHSAYFCKSSQSSSQTGLKKRS